MRAFRRTKKICKPSLPVGLRVYAIGDIHGRADLLQQLFTVIDVDLDRYHPARAVHVFLGDYVDRGPDTRRVLDLLIARSRSHETMCLKGNHEALLLDVLEDPKKLEDWRNYGGLPTLMSYGLRPSMKPSQDEQIELIGRLSEAMPREHLTFLQALRPSFTCGDFFFVHAGVRPGVALDRQHQDDLLWIREDFLNCEDNFGKYVVHGHTPVKVPDIRPNRINIDTGAYATGNLTLLTMQGDSFMAL